MQVPVHASLITHVLELCMGHHIALIPMLLLMHAKLLGLCMLASSKVGLFHDISYIGVEFGIIMDDSNPRQHINILISYKRINIFRDVIVLWIRHFSVFFTQNVFFLTMFDIPEKH